MTFVNFLPPSRISRKKPKTGPKRGFAPEQAKKKELKGMNGIYPKKAGLSIGKDTGSRRWIQDRFAMLKR